MLGSGLDDFSDSLDLAVIAQITADTHPPVRIALFLALTRKAQERGCQQQEQDRTLHGCTPFLDKVSRFFDSLLRAYEPRRLQDS
jgi:hypothetical protein